MSWLRETLIKGYKVERTNEAEIRSEEQSEKAESRQENLWNEAVESLPFIRSGTNHLARHSERGEKRRQTEEEVERQHQGMDRPGVHQVPEGS